MSNEEIGMSELPSTDFLPEEPQPETDEQPKSQMSELIEIFRDCTDYNNAMQKIKKQTVTENGEQRFNSENGKTYSIANAKKCIRQLRDRDQFKNTNNKQIEARDLTVKFDNPVIQPEPPTPQPVTEPQQQETYNQYQQPQDTFTPTPEQQLGFNPAQVTADPQIQKDVNAMLTTGFDSGFNGLAKQQKDTEKQNALSISKVESETLGLCFKYLFPNASGIMSPQNAALLALAGIFLPRVIALVPKAMKEAFTQKFLSMLKLGGSA